jgi:undecaprenyl phosphate N,N'-diacetylbacillosamine 1-phosphate transferase
MKEKKLQRGIKRLFDLVVSLMILVLFSPLWILTALAVKLTSKGPIFFSAEPSGDSRNHFSGV